jgi:hypothetical protein
MMRRVVLLAVTPILLGAINANAATTGWHVVKSGSSNGQFAIQAINATVNHPIALSVRLAGSVHNGTAVVSCSKGFGIGSWSRSYSHAGTFRLPMTRRADSCDIIASVGGSGRVVVQILAYR